MPKSINPRPKIIAVILLYPLVMHGEFYKGVIWVWIRTPDLLNAFMQKSPDIKKYFIVISTTGYCSISSTFVEDIHALPAESYVEEYKKNFPSHDYVLLSDADFISEGDYYPVETEKSYDILLNSKLLPIKRHELFIKIARMLKKKYHRDIKALVLATSNNKPINFSGLFRISLNIRQTARNVKHELYEPFVKFLYRKAIMDGLDIKLITRWQGIETLRMLYSKSKMHLLLSKSEGTNRAIKEAMLCNIPVMAIEKSAAAECHINNDTGKAVKDDPDTIAREIIKMVDNYESYSSRKWVLKNRPRRRACEIIWGKINLINKYPGYPDIDAANDIRKQFTKNRLDNYTDLNGYKGHWSENIEGASPAFFDETFKEIREKLGKYV